MAEETKILTPEVNEPAPDAGAGTEKETLNAFQKFMKTLVGGGEKEEPAKETSPVEDGDGKEKKTEPTTKTYTEDDLSTALAAEKQKWQDEQKEKERLSKLSPEEREKAEKESTEKKIADLEQKLLQKDLRESAVAALSNEGFPVGLAELVRYSSKEDMAASLDVVKETFKTCLAEAVNQKLKGKTPAGLGGAAHAENATKDLIAKNIRGGF